MTESGERIAKRLSRAGVCSRREAERWIGQGRVSVDGEIIRAPGILVNETSLIAVDGAPIDRPQPTRLWRYHKPPGVICSNSDQAGRPTVFETLPAGLPRVMSVGRLDLNSEGLLLLTNDGGLARDLELPATGWIRRYRVRVFGIPTESELKSLEAGVVVCGRKFGQITASIDSMKGSNSWLTVALREGKNREIRKVFESLGYTVNRLIRVSFGPFQLGNLPRGEVRQVPDRVVRDQLGHENYRWQT